MNTPLFLLNLGITVGLVFLSLWTGHAGRRKPHYIAVVVTVVSLVLAIWQAELYGRGYDFVSWKLNVHLAFATTCLASVAFVAWTGIALIKNPMARQRHKLCVRVFLGLLVGAVGTAVYMFLDATEKVAMA